MEKKMSKSYMCGGCGIEYDTIPQAQSCFNSHEPKLTGGSSSYYTVSVARPTSGGAPYMTECNDIIEALNMEYDVANVFKAAWRIAALRQGKGKPGQDNPTYDAEKIVFFGNRIIEKAK
jgi:hypothetical protein